MLLLRLSLVPILSPTCAHKKCEGDKDEKREEPSKYYHVLMVEATPLSASYTYMCIKRGVWHLPIPSRGNIDQVLPIFPPSLARVGESLGTRLIFPLMCFCGRYFIFHICRAVLWWWYFNSGLCATSQSE